MKYKKISKYYTLWLALLLWLEEPCLTLSRLLDNFLAHYLSGYDPNAAKEEKVRPDKALEAFQAAYAKYQEERTHLFDWMAINDRIKQQAKQNRLRF